MPRCLPLLALLLLPALARAEARKIEPRLVPGKFGKAVADAVTTLEFPADERCRTPPLTVECWARLASKRDFNVLVSCDPKNSSRHWELYTYAGTGRLAVYVPGYTPSEIVS